MFEIEKRLCVFCFKPPNPVYGTFFSDQESNLSVHQYCLFFASGLAQNGDDHEGFDGFLTNDIIKEVRRGKRLTCSFCKDKGATVGCCVLTCKVKYHYPCGASNGTLEQFCGCFDAFCKDHKPIQKVPTKSIVKRMSCAICLEKDLDNDVVGGFLKGPCCKDSYFHRDCLQKYALSSGYFFRCPTCNNEKEFLTEMKIYGIYIPERDALWEDGVTYADLLEVNSRCDSRHCYCPKGRQHFGQWGRWKLFRCEICGHSAIHQYCGDSLEMHMSPYKCDICLLVENKGKFGDMIESHTKECFVRLTDIMTDKKNSESRCEGTLVGGSQSFSKLSRSQCRKPRGKSLNVLDAGNNLNIGTTVKRKTPKARRVKQTAELNKECDEMRSIFRESIDFHKGFEESANVSRGSLRLYPNHNLNCKALSMSNNSRQAKYPRFQCEGLKENQPSDTVRLKCALHKYIEHRLSLV